MAAEVSLINRQNRDVLSEAVYQDSDLLIGRLECHNGLFAAVHAKETLGIARRVKLPKTRETLPPVFHHRDSFHFVDAVVLDFITLCLVSDEIVVFAVPDEGPGTDLIPGAVSAELHLLFEVPLKVLEANLTTGVDGLVNRVHIVIDARVHGLDAVRDDDLALQLRCLMPAHKGLELRNQLLGFFVGDKFRRLHGVYKQFQFREFKTPR